MCISFSSANQIARNKLNDESWNYKCLKMIRPFRNIAERYDIAPKHMFCVHILK